MKRAGLTPLAAYALCSLGVSFGVTRLRPRLPLAFRARVRGAPGRDGHGALTSEPSGAKELQVTSGQDVPGTRASGDAGGPPRRRRWLVLGVVAALVIAAAGAGAYVARQRSLAAMRGTGGRDAWTITRRSRFQLRCLEESALPLPRELAGNVAATQRYCDCLTEELATAFPSFTRASQALAQVESPGADADGQRAAEISRRCLASSR